MPHAASPRFTRAIVRTPAASLTRGLTTAELGPPDHARALRQHAQYVAALEQCGLQIAVLPPDEEYPDSTFVEDTAVLVPGCAIVTNPGAPSRRGEAGRMASVLRPRFARLERIVPPGTLDGGDVMLVGSRTEGCGFARCFVGLSARTNAEGARQLGAILDSCGVTTTTVELRAQPHLSVRELLHLKTGVTCMGDHTLVAVAALAAEPAFEGFDLIPVDPDEAYAANCLWLNGTVLVADGFPRLRARIEAAGFSSLALDMSEFRKLDGGLSCLSLRF